MIFGHSFESMNENSEFFSSTVTVASLKFKNIFETGKRHLKIDSFPYKKEVLELK